MLFIRSIRSCTKEAKGGIALGPIGAKVRLFHWRWFKFGFKDCAGVSVFRSHVFVVVHSFGFRPGSLHRGLRGCVRLRLFISIVRLEGKP